MLIGTILLVITISHQLDNGYLGRPKMPSEEGFLELEKATKNFMQMQYEQNKLFTKTMEEQSALLKTISHQLDNLNMAIPELQAKVSKAETNISSLSNAQSSLVNRMSAKPNPFATANAIQVKIDENIRLLAKLHARWEREDEMAREMKVYTITTSNDVVPNASNPLTLIGVVKTPTPCVKKPKTAKTFSQKSANFF
jgi:small-conductance mechanosensitive channel